MLSANALKVAVVLSPPEVLRLPASVGTSRVEVAVAIAGGKMTVRASLNPKSVRKAQAAIQEAGAEMVAVVLQGKLSGTMIEEAGIVAQPRVPKVPAAVAGG